MRINRINWNEIDLIWTNDEFRKDIEKKVLENDIMIHRTKYELQYDGHLRVVS